MPLESVSQLRLVKLLAQGVVPTSHWEAPGCGCELSQPAGGGLSRAGGVAREGVGSVFGSGLLLTGTTAVPRRGVSKTDGWTAEEALLF